MQPRSTNPIRIRSFFRPLTVAYSWMKAEAFALSLTYSRPLYTRVFPSWARADPFRLFTTAQAFLASFVRVTSLRCARQVLRLASWVFSSTSLVLATHASLFAPISRRSRLRSCIMVFSPAFIHGASFFLQTF